jgi:hypothetical protein
VSRAKSFAVPIAYVVLAVLISTTVIAVSSSDHPSIAARLRASNADTQRWGTATVVGHLTMTIGSLRRDLLDFTGSADFRAGNQAIKMSNEFEESEVRIVDGASYLRVAGVKLPHHAHWVKVTSVDAGLESAPDFTLGAHRPSSGLDLLLATARSLRLLGTETLDGERVTHYKFLLDLSTLAEGMARAGRRYQSPGPEDDMSTLDGFKAFERVPAETWIDSANRVRRILLVITASGGSTQVSEREDLRFGNFGAPVDITAPDPDDVVPILAVPDRIARQLGLQSQAV